MGEGIAGHEAPEAYVVELRLRDAETGNIPEAFPEGELGERQAQELLPAGEAGPLWDEAQQTVQTICMSRHYLTLS